MSGTEPTQFAARTDVGRQREHNEDNFLVDRKLQLYVVCDGMGGHAAGEIASAIAVRTLQEVKREHELIADFLAEKTGASRVSRRDITNMLEFAVNRASSRVHAEATKDTSKRGMGTTLVALLVLGKTAFAVWVGDSRLYLLRGGALEQLTEDHTVHNELVKRRKMSREAVEKLAPKNAITRAVGVYEHAEAESLVFDVVEGDRFLLCSDGLCGYFDTPAELPELTQHLSVPDADAAARALIDRANEKGGSDNITAVIVTIGNVGAQDQTGVERLRRQREILARMPLFRPLNDHELRRVLQVTDVSTYEDGESVIREGEKGEELFIVLTGGADMIRGDTKLKRFDPGEHFGEMALIRSQPRSATVISAGISELMVIRRTAFFEILRKEHALAVKLLWQFTGVLADRLAETTRELGAAKEELAADETTEIFLSDVDEAGPIEARPPGSRA
jgi:PPM family protein phosphatase